MNKPVAQARAVPSVTPISSSRLSLELMFHWAPHVLLVALLLSVFQGTSALHPGQSTAQTSARLQKDETIPLNDDDIGFSSVSDSSSVSFPETFNSEFPME